MDKLTSVNRNPTALSASSISHAPNLELLKKRRCDGECIYSLLKENYFRSKEQIYFRHNELLTDSLSNCRPTSEETENQMHPSIINSFFFSPEVWLGRCRINVCNVEIPGDAKPGISTFARTRENIQFHLYITNTILQTSITARGEQ